MRSSIWFQTLSEEDRRRLEFSDAAPRTAEVTIVGAGMIGLATAYYLRRAGVSDIWVVDRAGAIGEASGANAGGLWFGQQSPELGPLLPLAKASSSLYDELAAEPGFDFDFRRTGLLELLDGEADRVGEVRAAGFRAERVGPEDVRRMEPALAPASSGAVYYPDEGQIHPGKLGVCFVRRLRELGVRLSFGVEVEDPAALPGRIIVIAAGAWTPLVTRVLGWTPPIKPMRGHLLATGPRGPTLGHTVQGRHYYYWQLSEGHVAGGGTVEDAGFDRSLDPAAVARIREEMNGLIPSLEAVETACAWSGFRPYCEDLRPVVGRVPGREGIFVAAGHFMKGIMLAPVTGKILAELITEGRTGLPIEALDPGRFA